MDLSLIAFAHFQIFFLNKSMIQMKGSCLTHLYLTSLYIAFIQEIEYTGSIEKMEAPSEKDKYC